MQTILFVCVEVFARVELRVRWFSVICAERSSMDALYERSVRTFGNVPAVPRLGLFSQPSLLQFWQFSSVPLSAEPGQKRISSSSTAIQVLLCRSYIHSSEYTVI